MTEQTPEGWYPDRSGTLRWWDGNQWTDHVQAPGSSRADVHAAKAFVKASRPWYQKKRFIIPIAVAVLSVIGSLSGEGTSDNEPSKVASKGDIANPVKVGETVKLQGTQYTVRSVKKANSVGSEYFGGTANGVYIIVELTIENTKNETKTFSDDAAQFVSSKNKYYSTDSDASFAAMGDDVDPLWLEDMHPDVAKTGILVYDVPKDATAGSLLQVSDLFGRGEAYIDLGLK